MTDIEGWLTAEVDRVRLLAQRRLGIACDAELELWTCELPALRRAVPLAALAQRLGLRAIELDVLVIALAPRIDPSILDTLRQITGDRRVDVAAIAELIGRPRADVLAAFDVTRPLLRWRMVSLDEHGAIEVAPDVVAALCGMHGLPPAHAHLLRGPAHFDDLALPASVREQLEPVRRGISKHRAVMLPWFVLWGPAAADRQEVAMRLAAVGKRDALVFDPSVCSETELPVRLHQAQRHALIRGAALVIGPIVDVVVSAIVVHALREFPELVFLAVTSTLPPRLPTERLTHPIAI